MSGAWPSSATSAWPRSRQLLAGAWVVSLVATAASLNFSGVPVLGWSGMGLPPCELCWYQRILMYPLVVVLGLGVVRSSRDLAVTGSLLAGLDGAVACYHSILQYVPSLEPGVCSVGTCTAKLWTLGPLSIPNLNLIASVTITVSLVWYLRST